jgi:hypothetical protein
VERRFAVHAGSYRKKALIVVAIMFAATSALAAPKRAAAKREFNKGVAAYKKNAYAAASIAFGKSFTLESDAETLFAWAQAERKLNHCDKATELYARLLQMDLPTENKTVIKGQIAECQAILDAQKPKPEPPPPPPEPKPEPKPESTLKLDPNPYVDAKPADPAVVPVARPVVVDHPATHVAEHRPWYRDPVGDTFLVVGLAGLGFGGAMLVTAHSASQDISTATTYTDAKADRDKAESRGKLGSISTIAGGAFVLTSIVVYAMRSSKPSSPTLSGWLAPTSGGFAVTGGF